MAEPSCYEQPGASAPALEESWAAESAQLKVKCSEVSSLADKIIPKLDIASKVNNEMYRKLEDLLTSKNQEYSDYKMLMELQSSPEMKLRKDAAAKEITNCREKQLVIKMGITKLLARRERLMAMKIDAMKYQMD